MLKKIKNSFIKLVLNPVRIAKGRLGYHTSIKDIYVNNNTTSNVLLSLYILDINQQSTYIVSNISIPPKKRFEIPHEGNIELEYKEYVIAETKYETDLDIFCNYIETEKIINQIDIEFQNQNQKVITGINWSVSNFNDRKKLSFAAKQGYSEIPDIYYKIVGQKVIVYKSSNLKIPNNNFKEYSDRYEIEIYSKEKNNYLGFLTQSFVNVTFNILTTSIQIPQYRYNIENTFTELNLWNNPNTEITINPNSYYLNFNNVTGFQSPDNYYFTIYKNNLVDLYFKYISNYGTLKVLTNYDVNNLTWKLIDGFGGEDLSDDYYLNSFISLEEGTHTIKIDGVENVFETKEYQIYINKNQQHFLNHYTMFADPHIQVTLEDVEASSVWQISETEDFENIDTWYSTTDTVYLPEGTYYINFANMDDYTKPSIQQVILSDNLEVIFTDTYIINTGQITICKPSLMDESVAKGIKWRFINKETQETSEWYINNVINTVIYGEYYIEFQSVEDYFESFTDTVYIYKNSKTTYVMNNAILM